MATVRNQAVSHGYQGRIAIAECIQIDKTLKDLIHNHIGTFSPKGILQFVDMITLQQEQNSQVTNSESATYLVCDEGNSPLKVSDGDNYITLQ